jgi:hypothetical protein
MAEHPKTIDKRANRATSPIEFAEVGPRRVVRHSICIRIAEDRIGRRA